MDGTKFNRRFLKMLLKMQCEKETLDYVIQEMRAVLGEKMPEEDAVRAYLKDPGKKTTLTVGQQVLAMDKLLEDAEVNFRMICDMVRYQNMKEAGMVHSVDEFLQLLRSGRATNRVKEVCKREAIGVQKLRRPAAVSQRGDGGEGAGRVSVVRIRADA